MKTAKYPIRPTLILATVCLLSALVLAVLNHLTTPIIAENEAETANAVYRALLPEADSFTQLPCELDGVTAVMEADNGTGYVITAQSRGYGGQVPAAVAFSTEGKILGVIMMENSETPGLGQKVTEDAFSGQFAGRAAEAFTIDDIDAITGATISSTAAVSAIDLAISAYEEIGGTIHAQ